jgi:hypothetical protein
MQSASAGLMAGLAAPERAGLVSLHLARRRVPTESPVLVEMIEIDVRYR